MSLEFKCNRCKQHVIRTRDAERPDDCADGRLFGIEWRSVCGTCYRDACNRAYEQETKKPFAAKVAFHIGKWKIFDTGGSVAVKTEGCGCNTCTGIIRHSGLFKEGKQEHGEIQEIKMDNGEGVLVGPACMRILKAKFGDASEKGYTPAQLQEAYTEWTFERTWEPIKSKHCLCHFCKV
jgi:hypothetical protein